MKNIKTALFLASICAFTIVFFSFKTTKTSHNLNIDLFDDDPRSGGVGAILNQDRTGSPVSLGNCASCHSGGSGTTTVGITMKNSSGTAVTQYTAGATYTLELNVSGTSGNRRAVQGVVLTTANAQAGVLSGATGFSAISTVSGRQYLEHSTPATSLASYVFSATWTAPAAGTGTVTVYSSGLAANNNGVTSGDLASANASLSITELSVVTDVFTNDTVSACDTYTWINGVTYTSSNNTAKDTINLSGYDSIISLALTISASSTSTDTQSACDTYTWINGVNYTASNTTARDTLTNAVGCDSIISLNLTINSINTAISLASNIITATETGATYQWLDCGNSFGIISGETSQSFTANATGNYSVEITKNGCVDTSNCIAYTLTNINENSSVSLSVSPNPFTEFIQIEGVDLQTVDVQLYDVTGKEYSSLLRYNNSTIYTTNLPSGIYILRINGKTSKLIKH